MRKGDKITREMFKTAIIACSGSILEMKKHLDLNTEGSVYYLLDNKFADLKDLWTNVKEGRVNLDPELDAQLHDIASDLPPILTRIQLEIMEFIDAAEGHVGRTTEFNQVHLNNLIQRGFIRLSGEYVSLTEEGDLARIDHMIYGSEAWYSELEKAKQADKAKKRGRPSKAKPEAKIDRDAFMRPEKGVVSSKPKTEEVKADSPCHDENCIHQEVLEFLVNNRPELAELVDETLKMKIALRNVRAEIEKLGWTR